LEKVVVLVILSTTKLGLLFLDNSTNWYWIYKSLDQTIKLAQGGQRDTRVFELGFWPWVNLGISWVVKGGVKRVISTNHHWAKTRGVTVHKSSNWKLRHSKYGSMSILGMLLSPKPIKPNLFSWKGQEHVPLVLFDK
jgi:hypothetical protein